MRVAITGSHGMVGTALAASLRDDGHEVVPVVRTPAGPGEVHWDPVAGEIDLAGLEGLDAVVHLAGQGIGEKRWTDDEKRRIRESRTHGTALLCEALASLERKPSVVVGASGINLYGSRGDEVLTERSTRGEGFLADVVDAWEAAYGMAEQAGIRVAKTRSGSVLAPEGGSIGRQLPFFKLGVGGRIGSGKQWFSWISLPDEVRVMRFLLERDDLDGAFNACSPNPVTNAAFAKALGRALHRPAVLPIPSFGPKLLFGSELIDELVLASMRVEPARLLEAGFTFEHPTVDEALAAVL